MIGATAVLSKQVGEFSETSHWDVVVKNPLVGTVSFGVVTAAFCSFCTPSDVSVGLLLQRLVWCFFLHLLQRNLDGH